MPTFGPIQRRDLIVYLRQLKFDGPYSGKKHQFMILGTRRLILPNPHSGAKELLGLQVVTPTQLVIKWLKDRLACGISNTNTQVTPLIMGKILYNMGNYPSAASKMANTQLPKSEAHRLLA